MRSSRSGLLKAGVVRISAADEGRDERILAFLYPGNAFGERLVAGLRSLGRAPKEAETWARDGCQALSAVSSRGVVEVERQCCRFLTFEIVVEPGDGTVWLEFTGPAGTREFLAGMLDL